MSRDQGGDRREIGELVARYELEPELCDIYVEGPADEAFLELFLLQHGRSGWKVYTIDTVNVPSELVRARNLDVGERGEVLTLGMELSEQLADKGGCKPICIADSDALALEEDNIDCEICVLTDFTSMEMYAYTEHTLNKTLRIFLQAKKLTSQDVLQHLSQALVQLFLVRTVFHAEGLGIPVFSPFTSCCNKNTSEVELDVRDLVRRSLQPTAVRHRPDEQTIIDKVASLQAKLPQEVRRSIRGHDFVEMLSWFLDGYGVPQKFRQQEVLRRALLTSLEVRELIDYPMFAEILKRTTACTSETA